MVQQTGVTALEQDLLANVGVDPFVVCVVLLLDNPHVTTTSGSHDCLKFFRVLRHQDRWIHVDATLEPGDTSTVVVQELNDVLMVRVEVSHNRAITVLTTATKDLVELGENFHESTRTRADHAVLVFCALGTQLRQVDSNASTVTKSFGAEGKRTLQAIRVLIHRVFHDEHRAANRVTARGVVEPAFDAARHCDCRIHQSQRSVRLAGS